MADKEIILTEEQKKAINFEHDKPAIVSAAAGSGKTTLLVDRVVRLLSDASLGISADSLAIMTFTRNATRSMREKLNKNLTNKLRELAGSTGDNDKETYDYLKKQIFLLRQASISTIDAFCLRMIKENAEVFDLPLNFTIADNARKAALQSQALKAALEELYSDSFSAAERDALFFTFSFENDDNLGKAVLSVADKLSCIPEPEKWIEDALDVYKDMNSLEANFLGLLDDSLGFCVSRLKHSVAKYADEDVLEGLRGEVADKRAELKGKKNASLDTMEDTVIPGLEKYIEAEEYRAATAEKDFETYKSSRSLKSLSELTANLENNTKNLPDRYPNHGKTYENKKLITKIANEVKDAVDALLKFKIDFDEEQRELGFMRNALETFFKLLNIYRENYRLEKRAAGCLDFSDCAQELYGKLSENRGDNDFRRQLSNRFSCFIVDEFQDCNKIQASIFELLGEGRLFYVGDVKQSIYSFRGADPYIMAELCDNGGSGFKKLPLNTNFRSRRAVVETVNAAFTGLMTPRFGGVDYKDNNALNYGADYPEPKISELYDTEIAFVRSSEQTPEQTNEDDEKNTELARYVAKRIQELVNNEDFLVCDGKDENENYIQRRATYSDFIVLLRAGTHISKYRKALAELKIPSTSKSGSGFFEADEIKMAWNYLKIIDNPLLNEEFLKVLMSPIYRFSAEEAAQIKIGLLGIEEADEKKRRKIAGAYRNRSLYGCVNDCVTQTVRCDNKKINVKRSISPKLKKFVDDLKAFRYHMTSSSLTDLVRKVYEDTDLISIVAAFEDSPRRVGNIRQLQSMAAGFEARGGGGLGDFMRFLERAAENASKGVEEAAQPESGVNAVRIMTFHASKGLEAPVCIMSELQGRMSDDDYTGNLIVSFEHFMAMKHTNIKLRKKSKMLAFRALSNFIRDRELGSELRLLYVAMTRAREKLIMVSSISDKGYNEFDTFIDENKPPEAEELHDVIYENSAPFKCVFQTLMNFAQSYDREFYLKGIACRVSAIDTNKKRKAGEEAADKEGIVENEGSPRETSEKEIAEEEIAALTERINAKYAHAEDTVQQAKYSTTELAREKNAKPPVLARPSFASGGAVSGAEKGNAYHHCMEHFPFDSVNAEMDHNTLLAAVVKVLEEMVKKRKITNDELKLVEAERIAKFFESDLGKRMLKAYASDKDNVKREQPFFAEVNGTEVRLEHKGKIGIQGRIDMYFIEDGEIVVVDYKSDTINNLAKEQSIYEFQVEIYTKVLGKLTGMNVKDMYLYAFLADKEYKI